MFGRKTIKIGDALYARMKKAAESKGYASVEEFAVHALEKAAADAEAVDSEEEVRKRLKGLGYLG